MKNHQQHRYNTHIDHCNNCGKYGHIYYQCKLPIISTGIIAFRCSLEDGNILYLMICRKDTLGYVDFMRVKYNIYNKDYIWIYCVKWRWMKKHRYWRKISKTYGWNYGRVIIYYILKKCLDWLTDWQPFSIRPTNYLAYFMGSCFSSPLFFIGWRTSSKDLQIRQQLK